MKRILCLGRRFWLEFAPDALTYAVSSARGFQPIARMPLVWHEGLR